MRNIAAFVLTLILGIVTLAKPHSHHEGLQGKVGDASTTDLWRHYLLHVAAVDMSTPPPDTKDWFERKFLVAKKFRVEFEKAIDDFNASQESRVDVDQVAALELFIRQRDAMVESYKNELLWKLNVQARTELEKEVMDRRELIKSLLKLPGETVTRKDCGLPESVTCSITYSMEQLNHGGSPSDRETFNMAMNQILDGAAVMPGNPQHARHTPTVTYTFDHQPHSVSGKSVCADCYLYVNAYVPFVMATSVQYEIAAEGVVTCSEAGKFFDATWGKD
jgi:hypothetical protein